MRETLAERLSDAQDKEADLKLLQDAIGIDSVTGNETGFAQFLKKQMDLLGLSTGSADFLPDRMNVWGETSPASANAKRLIFVGHTDTVHVRGWEDHWNGKPQQDPFSGALIDGSIWGRGACDLKGGICAALASFRLLQQLGYQPVGGLSFAFIGDEESGEPGSGVSAGAHDLVRRVETGEITKPDFAVYVEPTKLNVYTAQIGFFIADVIVTGKSAYFGTPELGVDALKATHAILDRLWTYDAELARGPKHELVGASSVLVTEIGGGGYIAVPGECRFSLIRKLRPGEDLDETVQALENIIRSTPVADGITVQIGYPAGRDHRFGGSPVEIASDDPEALSLSGCVNEVLGSGGALGGAPYWSEMPFLVNKIGCPTVYCAPGDIALAHTFEERIEVESYLAAVRAFALFVADYCGLEEAR